MTRYVLEIEFDYPRRPSVALAEELREVADGYRCTNVVTRLAEVKLPIERSREERPVSIGQQGVLGRDYVDL